GVARALLSRAADLFEKVGKEREAERARELLKQAEQGGPWRPPAIEAPAAAPAGAVEVLLVNAPRDPAPSGASRCQDFRMPLGLMYISAFLKRRGVAARVLDAEAQSLGISGIVAAACELAPRVVGLNCHTLNRHVVYEAARALRSVVPDAVIVLGGAHPALAPELTLRECTAADAVALGEGERVMYELCRRPGELQAVPGICWRLGGEVRRNPEMPRVRDLDSLGTPDLEGLPVQDYLRYEEPALPGLWRRAYLSASRGCRFHCSFCTEHRFWTPGVSSRTAESVAAEIEMYRARHGTHRFYFYDDTLTDWPGLPEFCRLAGALGVQWSCSTRIDEVNAERLAMMHAGGCREIAFGLESGSERSLHRMGKGWERKKSRVQVGETLRLCTEHGIRPRTHFMLGFPWEERDDLTETVRFAVGLKEYSLDDVNFFVVKVYPGTPFQADVQHLMAERGLREEEVYDAWSVYDWYGEPHPRVRAKLMRFNDIPRVSLHPHLDALALRRLARNAYALFFGGHGVESVEERLWDGVPWS
ncbi:MAG: B12-binding domain-containing radical SAM protein, partial [Longimicrobiaceae bacterium]